MLYRKYRPKSFKEVLGQEVIVTTLRNMLKQEGKIPQVFLFSGPRGTGKTSVARILAKAISCEKPKNGEPCGACANCRAIDAGQHFDLIEIDAASYRGIEETKDLREAAQLSPLGGGAKIFIVDEAHMLTKEANNVLLKMLEEPPSQTYFILATTEPEKLLPTVVSRAQRFHFRHFAAQEIAKKLADIARAEGIDLSEGAAALISDEARGSMRDAESLLTQMASFSNEITEEIVEKTLGMVGSRSVLEFLFLLSEEGVDKKAALELVHRVYQSGFDLEIFTRDVVKILRKAALLKTHPEITKVMAADFSPSEFADISALADKNSAAHLKRLLDIFINALYSFRRDLPVHSLPVELAILDV